MRLILLKEPGRVECELPNIHIARDNQRRRTATCTFRVKKAADKIFSKDVLHFSFRMLLTGKSALQGKPGLVPVYLYSFPNTWRASTRDRLKWPTYVI